MGDVVWTPQAATEFEEILYYIRITDGRPLTARRIAEQMFELIEKYAQGLATGHKHAAAPDNWLYCQFKRWLIFYQPRQQGIEIMRIIDGARDEWHCRAASVVMCSVCVDHGAARVGAFA